LIGVLVLLAQAAAPAPFTITLKGDYLTTQITQAFKGTLIDLESDRRKEGHLIKGGQVQFGPGLGNVHVQFSVPREKADLGWLGSVTYRLRDVHLRTLTATATGTNYLLEGRFDGKGPQIVGTHSSIGGVVPGVYMQNIRMQVWLTPLVDATGRLTYGNVRTHFASQMNTQGLSFSMGGHRIDLLNSVTGYHKRIAQLVADKLRETLEDPTNKATLSNYLNAALTEKAASMGAEVKALQVDGSDLKVTLQAKPAKI